MKLIGALLCLLFVCSVSASGDKRLNSKQRHQRSLTHSMGAEAGRSYFNRVASFLICSQQEPNCNVDTETVAEIVSASEDGMTLIYSDSELGALGFVDISDPSKPMGAGVLDLGGEPTSVSVLGGYALVGINDSEDFINTAGRLLVVDIDAQTVVATHELGGQPDSVAVSPDGSYIAVCIENERDEDLGDGVPPQMPAGFLVVVDTTTSMDPAMWSPTVVAMTDLPGVKFPEDPEPEFVAINANNVAVVTLQENNAIVLVDLASASVTVSFSAGSVDLTLVDVEEEGIIDQSASLSDVPREPDGVVWIDTRYFATADEGDLDGGSRGFTIFDTMTNSPVYSSGSTMEHLTAAIGHYPDERSGNKGNEPENVAFGSFEKAGDLLFVNSERSSVVLVYDVSLPYAPQFLQVMPAGVGPEGGLTIPSRDLLVVASEVDSRGDKIRSVLNIYQYGFDVPDYPTILSAPRESGVPIPWSALSGLAYETRMQEKPRGKGKGGGKNGKRRSLTKSCSSLMYAVEDSFYNSNRMFVIDTATTPATLTAEYKFMDTNGVFKALSSYGDFSAADLAALINEDGSVNIDPEGIAISAAGGFWVVSEGSGTVGDDDRPIESLNFLFKISDTGVIKEVITLPDEVNDIQLRFGFEGVAEGTGHYAGKVVVAFQRAWGDEKNPRLGIYNSHTGEWDFIWYQLDEPESQNGGWVGLSDIAPFGDGEFLVLERDNQGGPDAAIKRIYHIDLATYVAGAPIPKRLVKDLRGDLLSKGGLIMEKIEGLAVDCYNNMYIVNDNDGVDDNSGETQLLWVGQLV